MRDGITFGRWNRMSSMRNDDLWAKVAPPTWNIGLLLPKFWGGSTPVSPSFWDISAALVVRSVVIWGEGDWEFLSASVDMEGPLVCAFPVGCIIRSSSFLSIVTANYSRPVAVEDCDCQDILLRNIGLRFCSVISPVICFPNRGIGAENGARENK